MLEKPSAPITKFDDELRKLVDDMFESMYAAHGVGLAAPQIGISKRIAVIDVTFKEDPEAKIVLVNPEIIHVEGRLTSNEGCLSLPEFREKVTRPRKVTARAQNLKGETFEVTGEELLARALLHETDHLNGKLYISHISALKRDLIKRKIRKLAKRANGSAAVMDLVFCGTPVFAVPTLEKLVDAGFRVKLVVTQPDRASGRGWRWRHRP